MDDNPRRRRFKRWYATTYGEGQEARRKFTAATERDGEGPLTKGRISQLFDDEESFGELAAQNLALRLGKPRDFFLVDRPEFGVQPDIDRATVEATVLADLRDIERINPQTYANLLRDLHAMAEGARASDRVIRTKTAAEYVKAERTHEKLGKAHHRPPLTDKPLSHDSLLGSSDSGFAPMVDVPVPARSNRKKGSP